MQLLRPINVYFERDGCYSDDVASFCKRVEHVIAVSYVQSMTQFQAVEEDPVAMIFHTIQIHAVSENFVIAMLRVLYAIKQKTLLHYQPVC